LKKFFTVIIVLGLLGLVTLFGLYLAMKSSLPSVTSLKNLQWQTPMRIYTADGLLMNQFGEKKRIPLPLEQVPQQLIDAILATEDDRFYLHFGVDPIGLGRAIWGQIIGENKGGASTISMQVARNFSGSTEQTYTRKLREIFTTFHIEYLLTKDEILALYINKIALGHRAFGFGAAAQVYYNKEVNELTLAQIAVLAGLPKAPSTMNPISRPERARSRRAVVLQRMFVSGYISREQLEVAMNTPITGKKHGAKIEFSAPYVAEMAHQAMIARYGREQAYTNGYKVYTTISSTLQLAAQQALKNNTMSYDQRHGYRGAVASLIDDSENNEDNTTQLKQTTETLSQQQIMQALANVESYNTLQPAVVIEVKETSAVITLNDGTIATIEWQGMAWARPYINDRKQGLAPKLASDILQYGDIIYVVTQENNYILSQLPAVSSALVALSPDNGAIQAAVGGFSFKESQFNRVTQAKRQVGSNIKPFLYSAALDHGFTLASLVNDVPINQWDKSTGQVWRPKNSPPTYSGEIRVKLALAQSKNVIAVRLLRAIGLDNVIPHIASFGFAPDDLPRNETLALGSAALTPLEMVSGFATFANGGFLIEPYIVDHIEDSYGAIVYQANPALACDDCSDLLSKQPPHHFPIDTAKNQQNENVVAKPEATQLTGELGVAEHQTVNKAERVISAQNAFLVTQALYTAIWGSDWSNKPYWQGTGYRAQTLKRRDIAGKTGTTNSSRDAWFSGYSRRLVTTAWIGFDDPSKELGRTTKNKNLTTKQTFAGESGAKSAQPAWIDFMGTALQTLPVEPFIQPENIVSVRIDKSTGKLTDKTDKTSDFEFFMLGTTPIDYVRQDNSNEVIEGIENINDTDIF
jgi:penicillin-binding protein 1A